MLVKIYCNYHHETDHCKHPIAIKTRLASRGFIHFVQVLRKYKLWPWWQCWWFKSQLDTSAYAAGIGI